MYVPRWPALWRPGRRSQVLAVALLLVSSACAADAAEPAGSPAAGSTEPPSDSPLSAEVVQSRQDQVAEIVRVSLRNDGPDPVSVRRVELVAPPLDPSAVDRTDGDALGPGRRVDVRVQYGEPDCAGEPAAVVDPHVRLVTGDSQDAEITVPVTGDVLDRLVTRLCGERRVAAVAELAFGDTWTRDGADLVGTLELDRRPGATERPEIVLVDTAPTVIFGLEPLDAGPPAVATLPSMVQSAAVAVRVGSPRCDPHALLESKKTYVFAAWVSLDGGEPIWLPVEARGSARDAMGALLADVCNLG